MKSESNSPAVNRWAMLALASEYSVLEREHQILKKVVTVSNAISFNRIRRIILLKRK